MLCAWIDHCASKYLASYKKKIEKQKLMFVFSLEILLQIQTLYWNKIY